MKDLSILVDSAESSDGPVGTPVGQIDIEWDPHPVSFTPAAQAHLDERWARYLADAKAAGHSLFNGPVTRLIHAVRQPATGAATDRVRLQLGPADYKTFLVTCVRDRAWFDAYAPESMAPALGNSTLLTRGDTALLGIRSPAVGVYPRRTHLFGGCLELLETPGFPATPDSLVAHLLQELHEELGLTERELSPRPAWPRLLAIAHDNVLGQPEAVWQWEVNSELRSLSVHLHPHEHAGSTIVRRDRIDAARWQQMTPMARLAWQTWSRAAGPR